MKKTFIIIVLMVVCNIIEAGCPCGKPECSDSSGGSNNSRAFNARPRGGSDLSQKTSSGYGQGNDMLTKKKKNKTSIEDSIRNQFEKVARVSKEECCESECSGCHVCDSSDQSVSSIKESGKTVDIIESKKEECVLSCIECEPSQLVEATKKEEQSESKNQLCAGCCECSKSCNKK